MRKSQRTTKGGSNRDSAALLAVAAVLDGKPNEPILLAEGLYVRACHLAAAIAPLLMELPAESIEYLPSAS